MHTKRKISMVVTDLDGTLLRSDKTLSPYTLQTIRRIREMGIPFVVATARPRRAVRGFLPDFDFDGAAYHNGAVIYAGDTPLTGFPVPRPGELIRTLLRRDPKSRISLEWDDVLYSNFPADEIWPGADYTMTEDLAALPLSMANKVIVEAFTKQEEAEISALLPGELYAQLSENRIVMIMNRSAAKHCAVQQLAAHYGAPMADIVAFGDDYNDVEMLCQCGTGVAMRNALDEVKLCADHVCPSCDEDGVAKWLEENVLG